jgi:hypothetical protein
MKNFMIVNILTFLFILSACSSQEKKWENAKADNTVSAFNEFIKQYPESKYNPEATIAIERLCWDSAFNAKSVILLEDCIIKYPKSERIPEAMKAIEKLYWDSAFNKKNAILLEDCINKYPNSQKIHEAKALISRLRISELNLNNAFGVKTEITEEQVKKFMERLEQEKYSTTIKLPVTYYKVSGTRCNETTVKTKEIFQPKEIGKACSLHLEFGELSITASYSSNSSVKHPLFINKRSAKMTHNGCSGPGLEMERTSNSESFLKTFSIEYHLIASGDVNLVIPDLIWGADRDDGYGHNGEIFENTNEIIKIEGLKCDIAKLSHPITSFKEALEIKTYIETIAKN